jgi:hypothetical protein
VKKETPFSERDASISTPVTVDDLCVVAEYGRRVDVSRVEYDASITSAVLDTALRRNGIKRVREDGSCAKRFVTDRRCVGVVESSKRLRGSFVVQILSSGDVTTAIDLTV